MLLIVFLIFIVAAAVCLFTGFKLGNSTGIFFFFIGIALIVSAGALINFEGLEIEEQYTIQPAEDLNSDAKVIDVSYTSYTAEDSISIEALAYALYMIGFFLFIILLMGVFL